MRALVAVVAAAEVALHGEVALICLRVAGIGIDSLIEAAAWSFGDWHVMERSTAEHRLYVRRRNWQYPFCQGTSSNETASPVKRKSVIDWERRGETISIRSCVKSRIDARGGTRG